LKLGTKLTLYLSLIIILVLSGYGYIDIISRRDILVRKMKAEARSTGRTLKVSLEKIFQPDEMNYIQDLIDTVSRYERTLGVIVYFQKNHLLFQSHSLDEGLSPYLALVARSIQEDRPQEASGNYKNTPVFIYAFPIRDRQGKNLGGVAILQNTSIMEQEIKKAKENILVTIFVLIGGTFLLILVGTRKWITRPINQLITAVNHLAAGRFDHQILFRKKDELSELAGAFNRMAVDLKKAQERIIQEGEAKLELERNLRHSEKLATIGQLASGLAHEIGTPLNIIYGRTELVKRKFAGRPEIIKNLDIILGQTERITRIIQQLLGFIRKKKGELSALTLPPLIDTTLELLEQPIQKQGLQVVKDFESPPSVIQGDADQLQQVFLNLFLNAIQSMAEGGTLRVTTTWKKISKEGLLDVPKPYLEVAVQDSGTGIAEECLKDIFNPFFTTKDTGTGLGLMVSQGIVQDHEGWLEVESQVGKGSIFRIYLPVWEQEGPGDEQAL
jgi:two-component system, NtrC family, sensor kinase